MEDKTKSIGEETKENFDAHFTGAFDSWAESNHLTEGIETQMLRVMAKNFYAAGFRRATQIAIRRTQTHFEQMTQLLNFEDNF